MNKVVVRVEGVSMHPYLQSEDKVICVNETARVGDIVLLELPSGEKMIHRLISSSLTKGDRAKKPDHSAKILAKVVGRLVNHKKDFVSLDGFSFFKRMIAHFSQKNIDFGVWSKINVLFIICLARILRFLENKRVES